MVDPTLPALAAGAAFLGKPLIGKLFGPTCDYLGNKIEEIVKIRLENIGKTCERANQLDINNTIESPGRISPRILNELFNGGSFIEDELTQAYFGGILLSSRNENGTDDRGLYYLDIIEKLSKFDIKLHFCLYLSFRKQYFDSPDMGLFNSDPDIFKIHLPLSNIVNIFYNDFYSEDGVFVDILNSLARLNSEGLISNYRYNTIDFVVPKNISKVNHGGIVASPTRLGALLFLWALGIKDEEANNICASRLEIEKKLEALKIEEFIDIAQLWPPP